MPAPLTRTLVLCFSASCFSVACLLNTGCKRPVEQADASVQKAMASAEAERAKGRPTDPVVLTAYQKAASEQAASPAVQIRAKIASADAEVRAAHALIQEIERDEIPVTRLIGQIAEIGRKVRANNALAAGYQELANGAGGEVKQALTNAQAAAHGADEKTPWVKGEKSQIPTLTMSENESARLKSEIDKLAAQKKVLEGKRAVLLQDAQKSDQQSQRTRGKESLDWLTRAAGARKEADNIAAQIAALDSRLLQLTQDQARAEQQAKQIKTTLDAMQKAIEANDATAAEMNNLIAAEKSASQKLVSSGSAPSDSSTQPADATAGSTMAEKAAELNTLNEKISVNRANGLAHLEKALGLYRAAEGLAAKLSVDTQKLISEHPEDPSQSAWKRELEANNASYIRLREASTLQTMGALQRSAALGLATRLQMLKDVEAALKEAGIGMPDKLGDPAAEGDLESANKAAEEKYAEADQLLTDLSQAPNVEVQKLASVAMAASKLGHAQALRQQPGKEKDAQELMDEGRSLLKGETGRSIPADVPATLLDAYGIRPAAPAAATTEPAAPSGAPATPETPATPAPATPPGGAAAPPTPPPTPAPGATPLPGPVPMPGAPPAPGAAPPLR